MASFLVMGARTQLTYDDYAALPDDGKRYELLAGTLYVVPSPGWTHQRVIKRLSRQLEAFFEQKDLGEVFFAPLDVILSPHDVAEPDILVATSSQISRRAIEGPPALVVEVISPFSAHYDRVTKAERYLALGVEHYWIVDPDARQLVCQRAEGGRWVAVAEGCEGDTVCDPSWPALVVTLADLWRS